MISVTSVMKALIQKVVMSIIRKQSDLSQMRSVTLQVMPVT